MTTETQRRNGTAGGGRVIDSGQQVLALCGIAASLFLASVVLVLATLTPEYSHVANTFSELGTTGAPYARYYNAVMVVTGLLVVAFAVGLHRGVGDGRGSKLGPGLVALFGLAATAGVGVVPLDPDPMAVVNLAHLGLVLVGFIALAVGMYVVSARMAADPQWRGYARLTRWWSGALLLFFLVWFVGLFAIPLETGEAPNGALQRTFIGATLLWIELTAIKLFSLSR